MLLFIKGMSAGIAAVIVVWIVILVVMYRRWTADAPPGLHAIAGGWDMLSRTPWVVFVLACAFGLGFFAMTRLSIPR